VALVVGVSGCSGGEDVEAQPGTTQQAIEVNPSLVIRQIGWDQGPSCGHVEIFNRSEAPAALNGRSLQIVDRAAIAALPSVTLQAGQSFLVGSRCLEQASRPNFDQVFPTSPLTFWIAARSGSFALVNNATPLECADGVCPSAELARITDLVGVDQSQNFEGAPAPLPAATYPDPTRAIERKQQGRQDTNNNAADFEQSSTFQLRNMESFWGVQGAAPPLVTSRATPLGESTKFIYEGANPVQTGVIAGTIDPEKAGWLVGYVKNADGTPNANVTVTIPDQPKYGQTKTLSNGRFDMIVNGGASFNLRFAKDGHFPSDRRLAVGWRQTAALEDVILIKPDPSNSATLTSGSAAQQVAVGSTSTTDGTRTPMLVMPANTTVYVEGSAQPLASMTMRLTEYTTGADGLRKMPAPLAPSTAYTYAVEVSVDEALTANRVNFKDAQGNAKDVYIHLENFLNFPVGQPVPSGYYDRTKLAWIGSKSGRIIRVNRSGAGVITVDVTGDNVDDNVLGDPQYASLGFTTAELAKLGQQYLPSVPVNVTTKTLWRVPINHMTPWDFNWPAKPPAGAAPPPNPPNPPGPCPGCCGGSGAGGGSGPAGSNNLKPGSIIGCDSQTLSEKAAVAGTPYSLHYDSARMPGSAAAREVKVTLTGATVHPQIALIRASIAIAGRRHEREYTSLSPNMSWTFYWDGLDSAGRAVVGAQDAAVNVTAYYRSQYAPVAAWGAFPSPNATLVPSSRALVPLTTSFVVPVMGRLPDQAWSMGGWTLNEHHYYDVQSNQLYLGSGGVRAGAATVPIISRLLTGVSTGGGLDGGVGVGPNGDIFVADYGSHKIRRIDAAGTTTTVVGSGVDACSTNPPLPNDNATDATLARLSFPNAVAVAPDGSLFIASMKEGVVRKATPLGNGKYSIARVAGQSCVVTSTGDGGPALSATLASPRGIALGPDGSIYIAETARVRRIDPTGVITRVAGNGTGGVQGDRSGEGQLASTVAINPTEDVAVRPDGSLLISSGYNLVSVDANGLLHYLNAPLSGSGVTTDVIDGGPLLTQSVESDSGIAVRPDGWFVFDDDNWQHKPSNWNVRRRIRLVDPFGIVTTTAITPDIPTCCAPAPVKGLAMGEGPPHTVSLAAAPNGDIIVLSSGNVYRIELPKEQAATTCNDAAAAHHVVSGGEIFCFKQDGQHIKTINARTGATLVKFDYVNGALRTVTDRNLHVTQINPLSSPSRYEIVAPYGQKTTIALDANGYATSIGDDLAAMTLVPMSSGLLDTLSDRNGNAFDFTFDTAGYLTSDANSLGAQTLSRLVLPNGRKVTHTTPLNRKTDFETTLDLARTLSHTTTFPDGTKRVKTSYPSGLETRKDADGTLWETTQVLDTTFSASRLSANRTTMKLPSTTLSSTTWTATCKPSGTTTKTQVTGIAVGTTELKCDPANQSALAPNPPSHTRVVRTYGATGETITTTSPENRVVTKTLDAQGRLVTTQVGNLTPITATYRPSGEFSNKLQTVSQGARVLTAPEYQPKGAGTPPADAGFVNQVTDALNQKTGFTRDLFGQVKTRVDAKDTTLAATTTLGWDGNGNLNLVAPPSKPSHNLLYNLFNGVSTYTPPDVLPDLTGANKVTTYIPTADREAGTDTLPGGVEIARTYLPATGQLDTVTFPGGVIDYDYFPSTHTTAAGKLSNIKGPYGVDLAFTYDGPLQTSVTWSGTAGVSGTVAFTYHDQSLQVKSETVAGVPVYFGYDKDNLVTCASATSCSPATNALAIERLAPHGGVTKLTLGNVTETIEYSDTASDLPNNAFGELRKQTVKFGNTIIAEFEYDAPDRRRDNLGRIKFKKETLRNPTTLVNDVVETEYGYDALNRLETVKIGTEAASRTEYDGNGNIIKYTTVTGTVSNRILDDQDRLASALTATGSGYSYTYGPNGEVATKKIGNGTYTLEYDALGSLKSYKVPVGTIAYNYLVDGMGRRVVRKLRDAVTHQWLYRDGLNPIAELNATDAVISRFVYASRANIPDFVIRDGKTYRIIADHLGSPRLVINVNDINDIPYRANYSATGVATAVGGTSLDWLPFGFAGGMFDKSTNLVRFGARDYDPSIGRWVSKDPSRFRGGINLYVYSWNDPVNFRDRTGRRPTGAGGAPNSGEGGAEGQSSNGATGGYGYTPGWCGSGWNEPFVPEGMFGADWSAACENHDNCYGTCGADKNVCDATLDNEVSASCSWCPPVGDLYGGAVGTFGQSAYDDAQAGCMCQ
jgi:RHS repeat-associated protein